MTGGIATPGVQSFRDVRDWRAADERAEPAASARPYHMAGPDRLTPQRWGAAAGGPRQPWKAAVKRPLAAGLRSSTPATIRSAHALRAGVAAALRPPASRAPG